MDHIRQYSRGICMARVIPQMIGAIVFFVISVIFFTMEVNDRKKVNPVVKQSDSSHDVVTLNTPIIITHQKIVQGKRITPASHNITKDIPKRRYNQQTQKYENYSEKEVYCAGEIYEYTIPDTDTKISANCGEYKGSCNGPVTKDMVYDTKHGTLACKPNDFKFNCEFSIDATPNEDLTKLDCSYSVCPQPGDYSYTQRRSDKQLGCPYLVNTPYNTCSMKLEHNDKLYNRKEQINGQCENMVNQTRNLFYSKETDDFKDTWNPPYTYLKSISIITFMISLLCTIHVVLSVKLEVYCHVQNTLQAANFIKNQL